MLDDILLDVCTTGNIQPIQSCSAVASLHGLCYHTFQITESFTPKLECVGAFPLDSRAPGQHSSLSLVPVISVTRRVFLQHPLFQMPVRLWPPLTCWKPVKWRLHTA